MKKKIKKIGCLLLCTMLILTGCQNNTTSNTESNTTTTAETTSSEDTTTLDVATQVTQITGDYSDKAIEADWSLSDSTQITLDDSKVTINGEGASEENGVITISMGGTYVLSGTLTDGQIVVNLSDDKSVQLVLNGVDITCSNQAPIVVESAKNTYLTLAEGTVNTVTDGIEYVYESEEETEPDAAIYSKDDLIINGTGSLTVNANYNDGIKSKDDLQIIDGTIEVNAAGDGVVGKDSVSIRTGTITINAKKDGIKSSSDTDATKGYVVIDGGTFDITAGNDGIQAVTNLCINDGSFNIVTNEGSQNASSTGNEQFNESWGGRKGGMQPPSDSDGTRPERPDGTAPAGVAPEGSVPTDPASNDTAMTTAQTTTATKTGITATTTTATTSTATTSDITITDSAAADTTRQDSESSSAKALKSDYNIGIFGGTFIIDSSDDSVHSNQSVLIQAGTFTISSGDDGIHADSELQIDGGTITISKSYEGLESENITINDGTIDLVTTDDGVNASGGSDGSSENGRPGQNQDTSTSTGLLTINGGNLTVNATGDGLDANGSIAMTGGYVIVSGPTNDGNGVLDYDGTFEVSGGVLLGAGSAGMAMTPSNDSKQSYIAAAFDTTITAGTLVSIQNESGDVLYSFTPAKDFILVEVSASDIQSGESYTITAGDQSITVNGGASSNLPASGHGMGGTQ